MERNIKDQVWKYPLVLATEQQIIDLPKGAEIVHFGWQEQPMLWARVSTDHNETEPRKFFIVGTGQSFPGGNAHRHGPEKWIRLAFI